MSLELRVSLGWRYRVGKVSGWKAFKVTRPNDITRGDCWWEREEGEACVLS